MNKNFFIFLSFIFIFKNFHFAHANENIFQHIILGNSPTRYIISEIKDEIVEIEAIGALGASGMYSEKPELFFKENSVLEWSWKVDEIHGSADIKVKEQEDFATSIHLVFGKKTMFSKPKVLVYAWVGNGEDIGSVVKSPRAPDNFRTIILGNASSPLGIWQKHSRDILADYERVYGEAPDQDLSTIGVFTDNDQTQQSVKSSYRLFYISH